MASIVKTPSNTWKAVIRRKGWPTTAKTFRTKRDAQDWARRTEDEMIRCVYVRRSPSHKILIKNALERYIKEITPTKRVSTQRAEKIRAKPLTAKLGEFSYKHRTSNAAVRNIKVTVALPNHGGMMTTTMA